uniref:C-type lectin domain-containing protein n=1 Tax=Poecilia latipinna TaxID=48699 RepID=A0A3B3TPQ8_9TELE
MNRFKHRIYLTFHLIEFSLAAYRLRYFNDYPEERLNWTDAKQYCVEEGGSLLSLHDEEEERMIFNYTNPGPGFWIGLKKKDNYTLFWSNGEIVNFTKSTVNISDVDQLCEAFENGSWKGVKCSEEKAFMCKSGKYKPAFSFFLKKKLLIKLKEDKC